jgi:hypothetical protein
MFVRKRRYARTPGGFYLNDRRPDAELESGYLQVCESYRDDQGRPRQRVICSLDTRYSLKQQIIEATTNIENCKRNIASYENPKNWRDARRAHIELPAARKRLIGYEKKLDGLIMAKGGLGEDWVPDGWTAACCTCGR